MNCARPACHQPITPCPTSCDYPGCHGWRHTSGLHHCTSSSLHHVALADGQPPAIQAPGGKPKGEVA